MELLSLMGSLFVGYFMLLGGVSGIFEFDLFDILSIDKDNLKNMKDVTLVSGPKNNTDAFNFGAATSKILTASPSYPYIMHALTTNSDFTFAVQLRITKPPVELSWNILNLASPTGESYFSVGIDFIGSGILPEGATPAPNQELKQKITIRQYVTVLRSTVDTVFELSERILLNKWTTLMVRIRNNVDATVYVGCKVVGTKPLADGKISSYPLKGLIGMTQLSFEDDFYSRFLGDLYYPQIIVGTKAFDLLNPCFADLSPNFIPPEPKPVDYDPTKFNKFQEMIADSVTTVILTCKFKYQNQSYQIFNNDDLVPKKKDGTKPCRRYKCKDGVVTFDYICPPCQDSVQTAGMRYMPEETWTLPGKPCEQYECGTNGNIRRTTKTCPPSTCKFDSINLPNECCPKCLSDTCTNGTQYTLQGCERTCDSGMNFQCPKLEAGCFCPDRQARNAKGKCVPLGECPCRSSGRIYQPGQSVQRSSCSSCFCANGDMQCMLTCFY